MHLGGLVGRRAITSMKLVPYEGVLFIHPPRDLELLEDNSPPLDHLFHGTVILHAHKRCEISSIVVKLVAYYTVSLPGEEPEDGVLAEYPCALNSPRYLDKGDNIFAWSLRIPRTAAPYERCAYGRVHHKLQGIATGPDGTIQTDCLLQVVANPANDGETLDLNQRFTGRSDELGPYLETLSSEHVTVGGVVHYRLHLQSVPAAVRISSITAFIIQSYLVHSVARPEHTATPEPHKRKVFRIDAQTSMLRTDKFSDSPADLCPTEFRPCPGAFISDSRTPKTVVITPEPGGHEDQLAVVPAGGRLIVSHLAKLPNDDLLRPTTQEGTTQAPIKVTHVLVVDIEYTTAISDFANKRIMRVNRPMNLSSCCCTLDALLLPSYVLVQDKTVQEETRPDVPRSPRFGRAPKQVCSCGFTLERLLRIQHAPLLTAHQDAVRGALETDTRTNPPDMTSYGLGLSLSKRVPLAATSP
ncbi:hypothetical protein BKA62DRAFT_773683 [Auriculariales sp. MPI-PUGE-AT-0066]|nr:hypothetical protein BKA62DRAFT_773683 [Auriculariales sp. MPI-PUGE-AT-0066]